MNHLISAFDMLQKEVSKLWIILTKPKNNYVQEYNQE